jgi:hypothetical protein
MNTSERIMDKKYNWVDQFREICEGAPNIFHPVYSTAAQVFHAARLPDLATMAATICTPIL